MLPVPYPYPVPNLGAHQAANVGGKTDDLGPLRVTTERGNAGEDLGVSYREVQENGMAELDRQRAAEAGDFPPDAVPDSDLPAARVARGWDRMRATLQDALPEETFRTWVDPLTPVAVTTADKTMHVLAPTPGGAEWVRRRFAGVLQAAAEQAGLDRVNVLSPGGRRAPQRLGGGRGARR